MGDGDRRSPEHIVEAIPWREGEYLVPWAGADTAPGKTSTESALEQGWAMTLDQATQVEGNRG